MLNSVGINIPHQPGKTVSGSQGHWYFYKLKDLIVYLKEVFGEPDQVIHMPTVEKVALYTGIIVFEVDGWSDATGHATIWDGVGCSDQCYFSQSKKAYIWQLTN